MTTAGDVADWWEKQRRTSIEWTGKTLGDWVEKNPGMLSVALATAAQTAVEFPMVLGSGLVDTLNLGRGAAAGGWGYVQDGLRLAALAAPLANGGRTVLSRVVAISDANLDNCTWIAATKALRETGTRHFAVLDDLLKVAGKSSAHETGPAWVNEMLGFIRQLGGKTRLVKPPTSMEEVLRTAEANRGSVVMFSVQWEKRGHTLLAQYYPLQGVRIADRSGLIVKELSELSRFYGVGIGTAVPYGTMAVVEAARFVRGLNLTGLAAMIALECKAVFTPRAKK